MVKLQEFPAADVTGRSRIPVSGFRRERQCGEKQGAGEKEAFFKARVSKELTRGFAILAGAQSSNYPGSLVGCVTKAEDLDRFADNMLPVDVFARFNEYVLGYGIIPKKEVAYRMACQEGWAPAPTNDIQKAFWDKAHQIPTKPIKVEFDPKTDKK